jgi:hypothetical protein
MEVGHPQLGLPVGLRLATHSANDRPTQGHNQARPSQHLDVDLRTSTTQAMSQRPAEHRFEAHDAPRGDVAGEGSVRARG